MDIIDRTIMREGGFVQHPDDPGGATNMGVTLATLSAFLGRDASVEEVRALDRDTARAIYQAEYMDRPGFSGIEDAWLREILFDAGVLWGPRRPIQWLQRGAGVSDDGVLGPVTLGAVNGADARALGTLVVVEWLRAHGERVQDGRSSPAFIGGWINRASGHLSHIARRDLGVEV